MANTNKFMISLISVFVVCMTAGSYVDVRAESRFETGLAPFDLRCGGEQVDVEIMLATSLPDELVEIEVVEEDDGSSYRLAVSRGEIIAIGRRQWSWRAPASGVSVLEVVRLTDGAKVILNNFTLIPFAQIVEGSLNGYRIGAYPLPLPGGPPVDQPPRGFIEIALENQDTRVSPHFTLKQFLCKQPAEWPRYLVLKPRLIRKLEWLLAKVNENGYRCDTLAILSGYRTPWYNRSLDNVKYRGHIYGGATDLFIDHAPRDGLMDDLNRDGKIDVKDAAVLYAILDGQFGDPEYAPLVGGLGQYKSTSRRGPYVHVDVRGRRVRWGD